MSRNIWITIPTYWGIPGSEENPTIVDFDHPSSLDTDGTLQRTLESLKIIDADFNLLLITAVTHNKFSSMAHEKVKYIVKKSALNFPVFLVSPDTLGTINGALNEGKITREVRKIKQPILSPERGYEEQSDWLEPRDLYAVFCCGALPFEDKEHIAGDDEIIVYYGAGDVRICAAM